jgi:multidrug transporter EmrE-like cation transporter
VAAQDAADGRLGVEDVGAVSGLVAGIALALLASVALNTGFLIQHRGLIKGPDISLRHPLATLRWLFQSRVWVAGLVIASSGWALHVAALSKAPLSVVQAFVAGGLALAVPIGRFAFRQSLGRAELGGICLLAAALALLSLGMRDHGAHGSFDTGALALFLAVAVAATVPLAAAPAARRPQALGVAGGALYGAADVTIKALTGIASRDGVAHMLLSPWLAVAALTTLGGAFCFQRGLQTGKALPVIALMTAATNALSIGAGFAVFGDPLGRTPALAAVHATALVAIVVAASRLAPAQAGSNVAVAPA